MCSGTHRTTAEMWHAALHCSDAGPPPGANMGLGMMNPEMMGMMPQHDVGMGFDMSAGTWLSKTSMLP